MLGFVAFFLFLSCLICLCTGAFGPAAACFFVAFLAAAAAGTRPQPPRRRQSRHYW
jgi:hypothetical protein